MSFKINGSTVSSDLETLLSKVSAAALYTHKSILQRLMSPMIATSVTELLQLSKAMVPNPKQIKLMFSINFHVFNMDPLPASHGRLQRPIRIHGLLHIFLVSTYSRWWGHLWHLFDNQMTMFAPSASILHSSPANFDASCSWMSTYSLVPQARWWGAVDLQHGESLFMRQHSRAAVIMLTSTGESWFWIHKDCSNRRPRDSRICCWASQPTQCFY